MPRPLHLLNSPPALCLNAALFYSFVPIAVAWSGGSAAPLLFATLWRTGFCLACLTCLLATLPRELPRLRTWAALLRATPRRVMALASLSHVDLALFALSSRFVDVSVTAVITESWPIILVLIMTVSFRAEGRYGRGIGPGQLAMMAAGLAGVVLTSLSQHGTLHPGETGPALWAGVGLAALNAVVISLGAFTFRWGVDLANAPSMAQHPRLRAEMFGVVLAQTVSAAATIPFTLGAGMALAEQLETRTALIALLAGALANGTANLSWRRCNLTTSNLSVNALIYVGPVLGLTWLVLLWNVSNQRPEFLFLGAALTLAAGAGATLTGRRPPAPAPK